MTDTLLALVPTYGVYLVAASVFLGCLALPLPASMMVLTAGGFAASGDLTLWQVISAAFAGFVLGDQTAFLIGRKGGQALKARLAKGERQAALMARAESFVDRRGLWAVLASRTIASPLAAYVSFVGAAAGMGWARFTAPALAGAGVWSTTYAGLGYQFADRLSELTSVLNDLAGVFAGLAVLAGSGLWLWRAARRRTHPRPQK